MRQVVGNRCLRPRLEALTLPPRMIPPRMSVHFGLTRSPFLVRPQGLIQRCVERVGGCAFGTRGQLFASVAENCCAIWAVLR